MNARTALPIVMVLAAGCRVDAPVEPMESRRPPDVTLNTDQIIDGTAGRGALYRMARPTNWNGDLVLYAHGYVSPEEPVALPPEGDLFISLFGAQGFAVAFSSYSENGWTVKDGAQRTHQLLGIFRSQLGRRNAFTSAAPPWAG